ncbi:hypothetical protein [Chryseobacterium sp. CT-SW4]|uniref:hypothetical protein n=1 Tax=Chryseobacterium sp. SW-1 TaxID=3157343 RepID=UPI003B0137B5
MVKSYRQNLECITTVQGFICRILDGGVFLMEPLFIESGKRRGKFLFLSDEITGPLVNVRLSYFNNVSGVEVLEENNYYPFGIKHEGYNGLTKTYPEKKY